MNPLARGLAPSIGRHPAKGLARCRPTIVFFGVHGAALDACTRVTRELRIACAETSHLHAACTALDAFPGALLVASTAVRHSERDIVEERAAAAKALVLWVGFDHDADDLVSKIRSWATPPNLPSRFADDPESDRGRYLIDAARAE